MKKSVLTKVFMILLPVFVLSACTSSLGIAQPAPDVNLQDMNGKPVQLSEFKGKVIILDFFATWCPPCKQEIPDFVALQKQYGDQGFVMIGVSLSRVEDVRPFAAALGVNYIVLIADSAVISAYGPVRAIPMTYIIDKDFKVAAKYIGYRPKSTFENDIKTLLAKEKGKE